MCHRCDYTRLIVESELGPTPNRLKVLEMIGNQSRPVSAREIFEALNAADAINRVTVYRILDLLVEKNVVDRISGGGRSFFYGLSPNRHHAPHPHFYCTQCGKMACLSPKSLNLNTDPLRRAFPGMIKNVEVRFDGVCPDCLAGWGESPANKIHDPSGSNRSFRTASRGSAADGC